MDTINKPVGLGRRLLAIFYDMLVIIACLLVITAVATATGVQFGKAHFPLFSAAILALIFLYFAWCWTHGGQTVGMKVWRFQLCSKHHTNVTWFTAVSRYGSAFFSWMILGLGFFWSLWNAKKLAWHDYLSDSYLIMVSKTRAADRNDNN